jgi:hypothetical protein
VRGWNWGLNSGLCAAKQALYPFSHTSNPFCSGYFGDGGLINCLPGLTSNLHAPDLSFPSNWDYRFEAPVPSFNVNIVNILFLTKPHCKLQNPPFTLDFHSIA